MQVPEITYAYMWPKDVAGPTFEIFSRSVSASLANATVTVTIGGIPKDRILVLTNVSMQAVPGLAQGVAIMSASGFTAAGFEFRLHQEIPAVVANQSRALNWVGAAYLAGRSAGDDNATFTAIFDAGAVANQLEVFVHGVVIPRGNAAMF